MKKIRDKKLLNKFDIFVIKYFKIKIIEELEPKSYHIQKQSAIYFVWFWEIIKFYKRGYFYIPRKFKK